MLEELGVTEVLCDFCLDGSVPVNDEEELRTMHMCNECKKLLTLQCWSKDMSPKDYLEKYEYEFIKICCTEAKKRNGES